MFLARRNQVRVIAIALLFLLIATPGVAQEGACCDLVGDDRTCFDDAADMDQCPASVTFLKGGTCAANCGCGPTCDADGCVEPRAGNGSEVQIKFVGRSFDGENTTFTYQICQASEMFALSHWVLGLSELCCTAIEGATGGSFTTETCGVDPLTRLFGLKFETNGGVPDCNGVTCGGTDDAAGPAVFTITLSGSVSTGCIVVGTKADGGKDTATACAQGPAASCDGDGRGACCFKNGAGCQDNVLEEECPNAELKFFRGKQCSQIQCSEIVIPAVSVWGLIALTLVLATGGKILFRRRRTTDDRGVPFR